MVSLDFIRFFVFWEKVYPEADFSGIVDGCYCDRCIENFQYHSGVTIEENTAEWIKTNALPEWTKWKCLVIEERVKALSAIIKEYNIPVALKLVPWRPKDFDGAIRSIAGQDIDLIKNHVDVFIPMTYSHMVKRKPHWINEMTDYIHSATDGPVLACVEISKTYVEENISDQEFAEMVKYGSMPPSNGTILFHYDYIRRRKQLIMNLLGEK